ARWRRVTPTRPMQGGLRRSRSAGADQHAEERRVTNLDHSTNVKFLCAPCAAFVFRDPFEFGEKATAAERALSGRRNVSGAEEVQRTEQSNDRWPKFRTARDLAGSVFPTSETVIQQEARKRSIGRKMGRSIIFTAEDCQRLYEELPCLSGSSAVQGPPTGLCAAPSAETALKRALERTTKRPPKKSAPSARQKSSPNPSTVVALPQR